MTDSPFWNDDWMNVQQKYWSNWTEMNRKAMGLGEPVQSPWEGALNHWWKAISPQVPGASNEFMQRMMDQGKSFFQMTGEFNKNYQGTNDWQEALNNTFSDMQKMFSSGMQASLNGFDQNNSDAMHKMMAFWEMPMDNWQRMVSSLSLMPGDVLRNMPHEGGMDRVLNVPGLGYTREEEGQYKELMQRVVAYQKAFGEYLAFFSNLGLLSVERMKEKVDALVESETSIDTARGLYDLWVSACEDVYGEQVMTPEYAQIHGGLVNALMALKKKMGQLVDENLGAMNMPTRRELRTLQKRLQESRREAKALRAEVEQLKELVMSQNKAAPAKETKAAAPAKPATRKKVAKKKVAAKKTTPAKAE